MASFPLLNNELTRLSRKRSVHGVRMGVVGLIFALMIYAYWMTSVFSEFESCAAQVDEIQFFFNLVIGWSIFVAAFAVPMVRATDAISAEKRDGTLGILLLANTRPADIVLAKYAIVVLEAATLLLCITPIYAMSAYFGGTAFRDVVFVVAWTLMAILLLSALGVYCSAVVRTPFAARVLVIAFVVGFYILFYAAEFLVQKLAPNSLVASVFFRGSPTTNFVLTAGATVLFLFGAMRRVDREARDLGVAARKGRRKTIKPRKRVHLLYPLLRAGISTLGQTPVVRILTVFLFALIAFVPGYGTWLLLFLLYWDLASGLQRFTQNGGLDDVRITDVTDRQLGRAAYFTGFVAGLPYLLGLLIGTSLWSLWPNILNQNYAEAVAHFSAGFLYGLAAYAALIAQALYWGAAWGRRRHNGLYIFFGLVLIGAFLGNIVADVVIGAIMWDGNYGGAYFEFYWTYSEVISTFAAALLLAGLAIATYRDLGKQWRSDLGPKPFRIPLARRDVVAK